MYTASSARCSAALNNTRFTDEEPDAIDRASGFAE